MIPLTLIPETKDEQRIFVRLNKKKVRRYLMRQERISRRQVRKLMHWSKQKNLGEVAIGMASGLENRQG